jgi:hypothetical protein
MDQSQLSEFKRLVENSQEIAIVPSLETRGEALLSSLALLFSLDNFNRKTSLLLSSLPASLVAAASNNPWQNKPAIVINRPSGEKISQLRYEKNNGRVYLWFNSHDVTMKEEDVSVSFSPFKSEPDLYITLGFKDTEGIVHPLFKQRNPNAAIISIDHHPDNQEFGQINLIDPESTLAEIAANAIKSIDENLIDRRVGAYILKGLKLYAPSREFSNRLCQWIACLVNQEALEYHPNPCTSESVQQITLLEQSLKKLEFYPQKNLAVLVLPYGETCPDSEDIVFLIDELRSKLLELNNFVVIWQPDKSISQGIVYLEESDKLEQLARRYPGEYKRNRGVFDSNERDPFYLKKELVNYLLTL